MDSSEKAYFIGKNKGKLWLCLLPYSPTIVNYSVKTERMILALSNEDAIEKAYRLVGEIICVGFHYGPYIVIFD